MEKLSPFSFLICNLFLLACSGQEDLAGLGTEPIAPQKILIDQWEHPDPLHSLEPGGLVEKGYAYEDYRVDDDQLDNIRLVFLEAESADGTQKPLSQEWKDAFLFAATQWSNAKFAGVDQLPDISTDNSGPSILLWSEPLVGAIAQAAVPSQGKPGNRISVDDFWNAPEQMVDAERFKTAMHELGHTLGFAHRGGSKIASSVIGGTASGTTYESVMKTGLSTVPNNDLSDDDKLSLATLYVPTERLEQSAWHSERSLFERPGYDASKVAGRVVSGDFDGDGLEDIGALYAYPNNHARWHVFLSTGASFAYQGNRGWWARSGYDAGMATGRTVAGDFNGDGLDDVAALYAYPNNHARWHVFLSTGTSFAYQGNRGWWALSRYDAGMATGRTVAGDFNGDGLDDVAALYAYPNNHARWHVFLSTGASFAYQGNRGWWARSGYDLSTMATRATAGDFDGNGFDDIAILRANGTDQWQVFGSDGYSLTFAE